MKQLTRTLLALSLFVLAPLTALSAEAEVSRAQFTTAVLDREPADEISAISSDTDRVFFFTELRNLDGKTVTHRWSLNGTVMAEVSFKVRASRWRVYSSKNLQPEWRGDWVVDIVDETGSVLDTKTVGYAGATMAPTPTMTPATTTTQ